MKCCPSFKRSLRDQKEPTYLGTADRRRLSPPLWLMLAASLFCLAVSCTKDIRLKLNSVASNLVIEGIVSNGNSGCYVKISRSTGFNALLSEQLIPGALVVLRDSNRQFADTLSVQSLGSGEEAYVTRNLRGIRGHVYQLIVTLDGWRYEARCKMPDSVTFQGISLLSSAGAPTAKSIFSAVPRFVDPKGKGNCYQFFQYVNGKKDDGINVFSDNIGDGLPNELPIFTKDIDIKLNDTLTVVMLNIDPVIYDIFNQLQINADDFGITPSNPQTNITGGALGYFSAQYRQEMTVRIALDP